MAERSTRTGTTAGAISAGVAAQTETPSTEVRPAARSAGDVIRAGKDQAIDEARAMVQDVADKQRRKAADSLGGMAQALHRSARDIEKENDTMARYTEMAAARLDEVAGYLRQADWNQIIEGAESFARRQPYWFIGGAVAAGFVLARFLRSSGAAEMGEGMGTTGRGGSTYAPSATAGYGGAAAAPFTSPAAAGTSTTTTTATARTGDLT